MDYPAIEFPYVDEKLAEILRKNYTELTKSEAKRRHTWVVNEVFPRRRKVLREYYLKSNGHGELDHSPESLMPIWKWLVPKLTWEKKNDMDIERERMALSEKLRPLLRLPLVPNKLTFASATMLYDVSIYFGDTLIHNHPALKWDVCLKGGKKYIDFHKTVIVGFPYDNTVDTRDLLDSYITRPFKPTQLFDSYLKYSKYVIVQDPDGSD